MFRPLIRLSIRAMLVSALLLLPSHASAQYVVDCSGNIPGAFTTINAVVPLLTNNSSVLIYGACTENVTLASLSGVSFGAPWGATATLNGNLTILDSSTLTVYGLNITSPTSAGILVQHSRDIALNACSSNGNAGNGLQVDNDSDVVIGDSGSFSNNAAPGISVAGNSIVALFAWGGPIDVSNNVDSGLNASRGELDVLGNVTISNNKATPNATATSGFGLDFRGASRGFLFAIFGPVTLQNNQAGGASLLENSELSLVGGTLFGNSFPIALTDNGPVGISAGFGSQVTLYDTVQVSGHGSAGIEAYANSQVYLSGDNRIAHNGFAFDPARAGIRLDGNSEGYLRGGEISGNGGPGVLALVSSTVDFSGVSFSSNAQAPIVCDSSAWMTTDLAGAIAARAQNATCRIPHTLGVRQHLFSPVRVPDWSRAKAQETRYRKLTSPQH